MIRVGILGTGWMAQEHTIAMRALPKVHVTAVASGTPSRAEAFATQYGLDRSYSSYEDLIGGAEIDAVHVCTRNSQHFGHALAALSNGKHAIVEKPLALSKGESSAMLDAANAGQAIHACNYNYRAYPAVQEARRFVQSGELGEVYLVRGTYLQDWLLFASDYNWRLDSQRNGQSSAMADIGTHLFDLIEHITGRRVVKLQAYLATTLPERIEQTPDGPKSRQVTSDDCATVDFHLDNGALGSAVISQISAGRKNDLTLELSGARASLWWSQVEPDLLWIGRRDEASSLRVRDRAMAPDLLLPAGHPFGWRDALRRNLESVYLAIGGEEPHLPFATFADGHRSLVLLDAVMASSATRSEVALPAVTGEEDSTPRGVHGEATWEGGASKSSPPERNP